MLTINTNLAALTAQRNFARSNFALSESYSKLSSGLRVRSAADDAAGLAISEDFKSKIRSLAQAKRNANDGVSLIQTADGALKEVSGMLGRMRELAVQAKNGTLNTTQRGYLDDEFNQLSSEIDRIVNTTEFNGVKLIDGTQVAGVTFQVGVGNAASDTITVSIATSTAAALGIGSDTLTTATAAGSAISNLDTAISAVSTRRAALGAVQNRLQVAMSNVDTYRTNLTAANSRIVDVDVASETATMTRNNILVQAGAAMLAQANQAPQVALSLLR